MKDILLKVIIPLLAFILIILYICDMEVIKNEKMEKSKMTISNTTRKVVEHKNYSYYELLKILKNTNYNLKIDKINKENLKDNVINFQVSFGGNIKELIKGIDYLKNEEAVDEINKIDIVKDKNHNYIIELDINLYKYK